jgi:hypothetical protein
VPPRTGAVRRPLKPAAAADVKLESIESQEAGERTKWKDAFEEEVDGEDANAWERQLQSLRAKSVPTKEKKQVKAAEEEKAAESMSPIVTDAYNSLTEKQSEKLKAGLRAKFVAEQDPANNSSTEKQLEKLKAQLTLDHNAANKPSAARKKGDNRKFNGVSEKSSVMSSTEESLSTSLKAQAPANKTSRRSKIDKNPESASVKIKRRRSGRDILRDARKLRAGLGKQGGSKNPLTSQEQLQEVSRSLRSSARYPAEGKLSGSLETINVEDLNFKSVDKGLPPVPRLSYGLDRVLFNPGVYQLQDPRSRVFNFDPYLQEIMPISEFDFTLLKRFITSSRDQTLLQTTRDEGKKYTGSTSSMTSALAHFHYLLSQWRPINVGNLTKNFNDDSSNFAVFQRIPSSMFLRWRDGVYAIDADKQYDYASVLSMLGQSMEKLLTLSTEDFEKYRKSNSDSVSEESPTGSESYHYSTMGDFLMRSQLDAYDPRVPGSGMFDLKTRAVVSIRMDTGSESHKKGLGYEIRSRHGQWESFEREYYDMIRSAFMKYSLQVRMGRMDGIFVAFHNTERIFGFQYISLPEMDLALHGTEDTTLGDSEFKASLQLLNRVLDRATAKWPEQSLQLLVETRGKVNEPTYMYIFAKPIDEASIENIQTSNKAQIDEFESRVLGLSKENPESEEEESLEWDTLQTSVQDSMSQDESHLGTAVDLESDEEVVNVDETAPPSPWSDVAKEERSTEKFTEVSDAEQQSTDTSIGQDTSSGAIGDRIWSAVGWLAGSKTSDAPRETASESVQDVSQDVSTQSSSEMDSKSIARTESSPEFIDEDSIMEEQGLKGSGNDESSHASSDAEGAHHAEPAPKATPTTTAGAGDEPGSDLLAMYLTIRNKVNGQVVRRPEDLQASDNWTIEYALADISDPQKAANLYENSQKRRTNVHIKKSSAWNSAFLKDIKKYTEKGRTFRREENAAQATKPVQVLTIKPEDLTNWKKWNESGRSQKVQKDNDI